MTAKVRLAVTVVKLHRGDTARQIVVQVEQGSGTLLILGKMKSLLRVLKKDMRVVSGLVEVEETESEFVLRGAHLFGQSVRSS